MRPTDHRKCPTRSYRNDYDFVFFSDSSASVLSTRNAARFDGKLSATGQVAPAETILSSRAIAMAHKGCLSDDPGLVPQPSPDANHCDRASEPEFRYRATLFDSVMDFLDRRDRMAARLHSTDSAE